jgi:hypothetical protein
MQDLRLSWDGGRPEPRVEETNAKDPNAAKTVRAALKGPPLDRLLKCNRNPVMRSPCEGFLLSRRDIFSFDSLGFLPTVVEPCSDGELSALFQKTQEHRRDCRQNRKSTCTSAPKKTCFSIIHGPTAAEPFVRVYSRVEVLALASALTSNQGCGINQNGRVVPADATHLAGGAISDVHMSRPMRKKRSRIQPVLARRSLAAPVGSETVAAARAEISANRFTHFVASRLPPAQPASRWGRQPGIPRLSHAALCDDRWAAGACQSLAPGTVLDQASFRPATVELARAVGLTAEERSAVISGFRGGRSPAGGWASSNSGRSLCLASPRRLCSALLPSTPDRTTHGEA